MAIGSHSIPCFYLAQFAEPNDEDSRKWATHVYHRGKPPRQSSVERVGSENGYFGILQEDGTINAEQEAGLEKALQEIEERSQEVLVCARNRIFDLNSIANKSRLAFYMGMLFARSTSRRNFSQGNSVKMKEPFKELIDNESFVIDLAEHYTERDGKLVTIEDVKQILRDQANSLTDRNQLQNSFIEDIQIHANQLGEILFNRKWQVWEAPQGVEFITSDNPVVNFIQIKPDVWHPGHGFRTPNSVSVFPLASSACLMMGIDGREHVEVNAKAVELVNDVVIRSANRFVCSRSLDQKVDAQVQQNIATSVPGKSAFLGAFPDSKVMEQYLRKKLGMKPAATRLEV